jgi:ABC-type Fe3+ transport system substrate-binding protein
MLDPKWKGKIATAPPTIGGTAWSLMAFLKMKYGDSYLKRLAAQQPKLYTAYQPVAQEVARGEFPVGMIGGLAEYPLRVGQGAPIHAVFPKDGVPYTVYPIVLTAGSAHPHAAELLANWYLSKAGQSREVEVRGAYSARYDVPSAKGNPPLASLHIWYPGGKMMAEQHDALINEFATLFGTK